MADYRYFKCKFWADPYIQDLLPEQKLLYIYLFTNEHGNQAGMYPITLRTIVFESGIESENIETILAKFKRDGKCIYEKGIIWVKNFVRHQANRSPKVRKRIATDLEELNNSNLIGQFLKYNDTLSIPYQYPIDTTVLSEHALKEEEVEVEESTKEVQASDKLSTSYPQSPPPTPAGSPVDEAQNQRPNYEVIHRWWEDFTFIPSAGRGKRLASSQKTDEEMEAIRDEIERIGSLLGTHAMIEVAQRDYDHKAKDEKPATLNYYLPIWRDLSKEKPEGDQERDVKRTQERLQSYHAAPESDPVKVAQALSEMKAVIDKAREPKGEVEE